MKASKKKAKQVGGSPARRDIGAEIIAGLEEAIAFEAGKDVGAVFKAAPISARQASIAPAPDFSAQDIAALRKRMRLSQSVFAQALNVSPETEKAWEQGKFSPSGSVKRLLQIATRHPDVLLEDVLPGAKASPAGESRSARARHSRHAGLPRATARR